MIQKAINFTVAAHAGQLRKFVDVPYAVHPLRVAMRVCEHTEDDDVVIAALTHDVLEDCPAVTEQQLVDQFGLRVTLIVADLTNRHKGNRAARKAAERAYAANMSPEAQLIRLADIYDNLSTWPQGADPAFFKLYLEEKRLLYPVLTRSGAPELYRQVGGVISRLTSSMMDVQ
jgi:(p)ppGpp synthase/HD superfamily hydrolase